MTSGRIGSTTGSAQSSGGLGSGMGGSMVLTQDDASCMSSPLVRANYLSPADTRVPNLVQQLNRNDKIAMLSGGERLASEWWTIDFNATGAPAIGLADMPMRDGPRGVHQLNNAQSTTFAAAEARAAAFDLGYRVGAVIAAEMKAFKYDVMLAPTMNILRHPGWGRAQETYGEDPALVGNMAAAFVRGMQDNKMMACAKHFAVNNTEDNRGDGTDEPNAKHGGRSSPLRAAARSKSYRSARCGPPAYASRIRFRRRARRTECLRSPRPLR